MKHRTKLYLGTVSLAAGLGFALLLPLAGCSGSSSDDPVVIADADGDGVADAQDVCANTPAGATVTTNGCADADADGVADATDLCANTPAGTTVLADGCADPDADGVSDATDVCPNTPAGTTVAANGCPVPATVTVSTAAKAIIVDNCAGCHVARPASHTVASGQAVEQCGVCHIPYGNASFGHDATFTGCPGCHTSPEVTHFFLRDDTDQTILKDGAEADCIACHRDGGQNTTGRGRPALDTDDGIIAAARNGTLRGWVQPGGFMAKYLTDTEAATLTSWIDTTFGDRLLTYNPYLDAAPIDADFAINGMGDNAAWAGATEHVVSVDPTIYTSADEIKLKALYSADYLYVRVEYADETLSMTRAGSWLMDAGAWRPPRATTENDKQSEDRVAFVWNMTAPNFKERSGCAIKCHGNVPGSSEFNDAVDSVGDIWHTKAARGLGLDGGTINAPLTILTDGEEFEATAGSATLNGVLDDKRLVWYQDIADGYDTEDSGRRGDAGGSSYSHNHNGTKSAPKVMESNPTDWLDAMSLSQTEIDAGETIVADPADAGYDATAVASAWAVYAGLNAVVPERILREPAGSRGDVLNSATWANGVWVNEFRRALTTTTTGNADDVQFDLSTQTEYDYSVTVFDNCGRGEIPPGHTTYGDGQYQILRFIP